MALFLPFDLNLCYNRRMITYNKETKTFRLDMPESTYCITISERGYIAHTYFGSKIGEDDISYLTRQ